MRELKTGSGDQVPSEHFEQRELVSWFRKSYRGVRIFAIPNGGRRSITEALRLKVEGVCAGVPDLFIPEWCLWVEMKRQKGGRVSPDQKDWHDYLTDIGHRIIIGYGMQDAVNKIEALRGQDNVYQKAGRAADCD